MKKYLLIALSVILLLGGCAQPENMDDTQPEQTVTEETIPGLYVDQSQQETGSGGAVRRYDLPDEGNYLLTEYEGKILLASGDTYSSLTLLSGENCVPAAPVTIDAVLNQNNWQVTPNGFVYYADHSSELVYLDSRLQEFRRILLPKEVQGDLIISQDGERIYYCAGQEIRILETDKLISRMLKSHNCATQKLTDIYFDGRLLTCHATYEDGTENTLYISAENGQTLYAYNEITQLDTWQGNFLAKRNNGIVKQVFFGSEDGTAQQLNIGDCEIVQALALGGAVQYIQAEDGTLSFAFYDLSSGKKTSAVTLSGVSAPKKFLVEDAGYLWMLTTDTATGKELLLRWDIKATSVQDETVYTGTFFTAKNPDNAGIKSCRSRANKLEKTYGIKLNLWKNAVKRDGGYRIEVEYQPEAITRCLDNLVPVLKEFPDNFLKKATSDGIRICVVRSVDGQQKCVQFWDGGSFYILVSAGADLRQGIMSCLGYVIDTHILGNSSRYDYWKPLNPQGFDYADAATHLEEYLSGENRAFADEESMISVRDDRSRMFYYAMLPDNAEMFKSVTMQKKLRLVCKGIRNAWDWRREEAEFPWEQYLNESIAYKK